MNRKLVYLLELLLIVLAVQLIKSPVQADGPDPIAVDSTNDPQATGYPDSRKSVRDSKGNVYIAYRKKASDGAQHIFVAKLPEGKQKFTNSNKPIESVLVPYTQRVPSLAIDEDDVLHVTWYGLNANSVSENDRQIRYTRTQGAAYSGLKWTPVIEPAGIIPGYETILPPPKLWQEHPVIFAGPNQILYIAWEGKDKDHTQKAQVKWVQSQDGGATWSPWQNIPGNADHYYSRPTILATDDGSKLYVLAYASESNGVAQIVWTQSLGDSSNPGASWDIWRYVTDTDSDGVSNSTQDQRHFSIVMESNQQLHLVWRQKLEKSRANGKTQIHYATFPQDGKWSEATPLLPNDKSNQSFPSLTIDKDSRLWTVWSESPELPEFPNEEPVTGEVRAAKKPKNNKWQPTETPVLSKGVNALYPTLRWQRYGSLYGVDLVWVETTVSDSTVDICAEDGEVKCKIYYTDLAGQ